MQSKYNVVSTILSPRLTSAGLAMVIILSGSALAEAQSPVASTPSSSPSSSTPVPVQHSEPADPCLTLPADVQSRVKQKPEMVTEIATEFVAKNQACACEIVKAAIEATEAPPETIAAIVEAAILAAPEHIRIIAQCAIAVAPDAFKEIQAVLARLDPNRGESAESSKSAKSAKGGQPSGGVADLTNTIDAPNPLNFPGQGPVGPIPGGPGGIPLIPVNPPFIIAPPPVTEVNP